MEPMSRASGLAFSSRKARGRKAVSTAARRATGQESAQSQEGAQCVTNAMIPATSPATAPTQRGAIRVALEGGDSTTAAESRATMITAADHHPGADPHPEVTVAGVAPRSHVGTEGTVADHPPAAVRHPAMEEIVHDHHPAEAMVEMEVVAIVDDHPPVAGPHPGATAGAPAPRPPEIVVEDMVEDMAVGAHHPPERDHPRDVEVTMVVDVEVPHVEVALTDDQLPGI